MNKKILIITSILLILIALIGTHFLHIHEPVPTEEQLVQRFSELKTQYDEKKAQGYNVREAERFARQAKQSFDKKDYKTANKFLDKAFEALEKSEIQEVPIPAVCGNNICESGEDGYNCPKDCCVSGDGKCPAGCTSFNDNDCKPTKVKAETICTDGIDNDRDGLVDNKDGDCWIKEGAITNGQLCPTPVKFNTWKELVPILHDIGFKTLFLFPVMEREDTNYYATLDHYKLHPALISDGAQETGEEELQALIDTAHTYDMKVILDINTYFVPSTLMSPENSWIALNHPEWVLRDTEGRPVRHWLKHIGYNYVITDYTNPELIDYFVEVMEYYTKKYNIDGWRIDAPTTQYYSEDIPKYIKEGICGKTHYCEQIVEGDHSAYRLWKDVRKNLDKIKQGTLMLFEGPHIGFPYIPENCDIKDTSKPIPSCYPPAYDEVSEISYSFRFQRLCRDFIIKGETNSNDLVEWFNDETILYGRTRARYYARDASGGDPAQQKIIQSSISYPFITLECTVPGVPFIYLPEFLYFENGEHNFYNSDKQTFLTKVLSIRNNNNALKYGSISNVWKSGDNIYAYLREYEDEKAIVVINFLDKEATSYLDLSFFPKRTILYDKLNDEEFTVTEPSNFKISVPAYGSRILISK